MVCTRVPGSRADRRRQKVWRVEATCGEVTALMDHLRCEGIQRLVLESTSDYWRIWYYLAEAAGLEVWLVNARDVKHLPGRGKSDRLDCVWHCKLNERGMLRRSFVPPEPVRDLRALTRTRSRLAQDQARHQARVEKILEDALLKISGGDLGPVRAPAAAGSWTPWSPGSAAPRRWPRWATTGCKATRPELEEALTGRFRDIHAFEISMHLRLIDAINAEIAAPGRGGSGSSWRRSRAPRRPAPPAGWPAAGTPPAAQRGHRRRWAWRSGWMRSPGSARVNAQVIIAELGTDPSQFPTPGHAAAWARLTPRAMQSGETAKPGRTGKGNRYLRGALGQAAMTAARTDTRLGAHVPADRPQARQAESHRRGLPRHLRDRLDPHLRPRRPLHELGPDYYSPRSPARQTRDKIREIERLNPGKKVILAPIGPGAGAAA